MSTFCLLEMLLYEKNENIIGGGTQILKGGRGHVTQFPRKLTSTQKSTLVILNHLIVFLKNMESNRGRKKILREAPQLLDQYAEVLKDRFY